VSTQTSLSLSHAKSAFLKAAINMISDDQLYSLAIFLGSAAMLLIILYHFLEINAVAEPADKATTAQVSANSESIAR
jgi:oligosaccharyl transferase complex subunit OST4